MGPVESLHRITPESYGFFFFFLPSFLPFLGKFLASSWALVMSDRVISGGYII